MRQTLFGIGVLLASGLSTAHSQSFNIDLDIFGGTPEIGNGAPSGAFGAAANQPGRWNRVNGSASIPIQLFGLDGNPTNVWITASGGTGSRGGWNNPLNTGDYALLLNDTTIVFNGPITWTVSGLENGVYRLFTHAICPVPDFEWPAKVSVTGSSSSNPQIVTGPMPGNSFEHLVTHAIHDVVVPHGLLIVTVETAGDPNTTLAYVNGFQLVAVPEPISAAGLAVGLVILALRNRDETS